MWLDDFGPTPPSRDKSVIRHILEARAAESPDKVFARFDSGEAWTYGQTLVHARRAAAGLAGLGVVHGDIVFALLRNGPDFLKTWFGVNFLGAALAAPNIALRGATLQHMTVLSAARVAVIEHDFVSRLRDIDRGEIATVVVAGGAAEAPPDGLELIPLAACFDAADPATAPDVIVEPWDVEFILFTSGTTGPSKGAIVTYVQMHDMVTASMSRRLGPDDIYMVNTPLFHIGASRAVHGMLMLGGAIVVIPSFRTETFWDTARKHSATACVLIGSAAEFLMQQPPRPDDRDHPMRYAGMSPLVRDAPGFARRFGVDIVTSFGMSEVAIPITSPINPTDTESCGRLRPGLQARIVDEFDRELPDGEVGELILRADRPWSISPGYWRMPEATAEAWRNGWFHTGDRMRRIGGEYYFVDRQKDAIRRRGENISSSDVEAELLSHPQVRDAAAIGVPSPLGEQDVMAVIVLTPGAELDPKDLLEFLRKRMAPFMIPRYVRHVSELPRTPSLRVQKHLLRAEGVTSDTWDREAAGVVIRRDS